MWGCVNVRVHALALSRSRGRLTGSNASLLSLRITLQRRTECTAVVWAPSRDDAHTACSGSMHRRSRACARALTHQLLPISSVMQLSRMRPRSRGSTDSTAATTRLRRPRRSKRGCLRGAGSASCSCSCCCCFCGGGGRVLLVPLMVRLLMVRLLARARMGRAPRRAATEGGCCHAISCCCLRPLASRCDATQRCMALSAAAEGRAPAPARSAQGSASRAARRPGASGATRVALSR